MPETVGLTSFDGNVRAVRLTVWSLWEHTRDGWELITTVSERSRADRVRVPGDILTEQVIYVEVPNA